MSAPTAARTDTLSGCAQGSSTSPSAEQAAGEAERGCCRHGQGLETLLPPSQPPLCPGKQKAKLPMTFCWQEVRCIQLSCLVLSGHFPSFSQHSLNSLCEPARCVAFQSLSVSLCWHHLPANKLPWSEIKGKTSSPLRMYLNIFATLFLMEKYGKMLHSQYITHICVCKQIYHTICRVVLPSPPYSFPFHLYSTAPVYFIPFLQLDTLVTFILSHKKSVLSVEKNI